MSTESLIDLAAGLSSVQAAAKRLNIPIEDAARRTLELADIDAMRPELEEMGLNVEMRARKITEAVWYAGRYLR